MLNRIMVETYAMAREYGPLSNKYDDDLYKSYLKLTVYTAGKLAPYQTPQLATVKVGGDRDNLLLVREGVTSKQIMEELRQKWSSIHWSSQRQNCARKTSPPSGAPKAPRIAWPRRIKLQSRIKSTWPIFRSNLHGCSLLLPVGAHCTQAIMPEVAAPQLLLYFIVIPGQRGGRRRVVLELRRDVGRLGVDHHGTLPDPLVLRQGAIRDHVLAGDVLELPGVAPVRRVAVLQPEDRSNVGWRHVLDVRRVERCMAALASTSACAI
jgi:hypothetical protein